MGKEEILRTCAKDPVLTLGGFQISLLILLGLFFQSILLPVNLLQAAEQAALRPSPLPTWESIDDSDGIKVYRREIPGSPIVAFRGEGMIDASLTRVASVLVDEKRATEWIDSLIETHIVKAFNEFEYEEYNHIGTPFPLKDRDFVSFVKVEADKKAGAFVLKYKPYEDPQIPEKNYVRGKLIDSILSLRSQEERKRTFVEVEINCDPMGMVPKWVVNLFQRSWPRNTIDSLRKQVAKPDIHIHPEIQKLFGN
jgi:hypothetical protein